MIKRWIPIYLFMILILVSCQNDKPKPETNLPFSFHDVKNVHAASLDQKDPFFVKHHVAGRDVFIECIVHGVSFREKEAKILVYMDGRKAKEVKKAAFILKGLEPGKHHIKLVLKKETSANAPAIVEFDVLIK
ncbi:hypothetical protein [Niallia sp. Krafla_26]|uniref:hypothetical protein n=1 Tax=Niallia sp. Krafla_26 TaxID=3064703 RepID=UPI003D185220